MKELFAAGLLLVLLQACSICSWITPAEPWAQITSVMDRNGVETRDGGSTTERVQTVSGTARDPNPDTPWFDGRVVLERNGEKQFVTPELVEGIWVWSGDLVLTQGRNELKAYVEDESGVQLGRSGVYVVHANIPARDITVTLTWNTDGTDVDLHVWDPGGNHAWYGDLGGIPGGSLDIDDTDGFGPETFTAENAAPGEWVVKVRYYNNHGVEAPTMATVKVTLREGRTQTFTHVFTADQANANDPSNDWEVIRFTIPPTPSRR